MIKDHNIYVAKSFQVGLANWWMVVKTLYISRLYTAFVLGLFVMIVRSILDMGIELSDVYIFLSSMNLSTFLLGWEGLVLLGAVLGYFARKEHSVYLVDFALFQPPESWRVSQQDILKILKHQQVYSEESMDFMEKVLARSGTGDATHWPPEYTKVLTQDGTSEDTVDNARTEFEQVVYPAVEEALKRARLKAEDVDYLIVNCSLFSPTPSLCSMVALRFNMRSDLRSYNLSGMGCSASIIAVDLAKQLLSSEANRTALVVSTENLTRALYKGQDRGMLLQNTLFRCGAAAIVLSNKHKDASRAKYKLLYSVRTQRVQRDAYECVYECQDSSRNQGIRLSKDIVEVAGKALTMNLTTMGPLILPLSEQLKVAASIVGRRILPVCRKTLSSVGLGGLGERFLPAKVIPYIPDFTRCVDHFCIHAGGRAVIDGIEKNLKLPSYLLESSRATLRDFGNTSSSSIWYELRYEEEFSRMKRGDRVLQIAFGSGFKCNSAVWLRLK